MKHENGSFLWGVFAGVILTLAFMGMSSCAGSTGDGDDPIVVVDEDGNPPPDGTPMGYVGFHMNWPERGLNALINSATKWFIIELKESAGAKYFASLAWPDTDALLAVPVGTYTVEVPAFRDDLLGGFYQWLTLLSYGSVGNIVVESGQTTEATVTLAPSSLAFSEPQPPVYYGSAPVLELTFGNWPLEFRQAEISFFRTDASFPNSSIAFLCTSPATEKDTTTRGCQSAPLPSSGSAIVFYAGIEAAAAWNAPLCPTTDCTPNIEALSDEMAFQSPTGNLSIGIQ
ncbi:MAG: hypothetical protein HYS44_02475 [Candidatus Niyogibacteria bacterium]|nr:hypothetical protein [Candidatus Niyogibacteria bacterium]